MHLSLVIVNWNSQPHVSACLDSILNHTDLEHGCEIIIVDNASSDNSVKIIQQEYPTVKVIVNARNVGFAAASNQGIRIAQGELVMLLNPDTIVMDDSLQLLCDIMDHETDVGVVGPQLLNKDGSIQPSVISYPSLSSGLTGFFRTRFLGTSKTVPDDNEHGITYVPSVSGACLMARRAVFQDVGLLDESFFMYGEEVDFCYRVNGAGWKIAYAHAASVIHLGGQSTKQAAERMEVERKKSRIRFVMKHRGRAQAIVLAALIEIAIGLRCVFGIKDRQAGRSRRILSMYHKSVYPMLLNE